MTLKELYKSVTLQQLMALPHCSSQWCLATAEVRALCSRYMAWFLYLCMFLVLTLFVLQLKPRMSAHGSQELPHLPALPLIGSLLSLRSPQPPHVLFKELQKKYGQTYSLMMGSHCVIIVNQHTHAKEVLLKKGKIFAGRPRTVGIFCLHCYLQPLLIKWLNVDFMLFSFPLLPCVW